MIIPIRCPTAGPSSISNLPPQLARIGNDEIVLLELQGSILVEGDKSGQLAAKMTLEDKDNAKPTMVIGHHMLEGKIQNLSKPLAVLRKQEPQALSLDAEPNAKRLRASSPMPMEDDGNDGSGPARHKPDVPSYDVVAIVKRKIVFSKRPVPIVSLPKGQDSRLSRQVKIRSGAGGEEGGDAD